MELTGSTLCSFTPAGDFPAGLSAFQIPEDPHRRETVSGSPAGGRVVSIYSDDRLSGTITLSPCHDPAGETDEESAVFKELVAWAGVAIARERDQLEIDRLLRQPAGSRSSIAPAPPLPRPIIGRRTSLASVMSVLARLAGTSIPVLLLGETGTGKELAAREIHERSSRRKRKFIAINAATIPVLLAESILFGRAKGIHTDATYETQGLLGDVEDGTLFIDEIADLPLEVQAKILRAMQEKVYSRLGESEERPFLGRFVFATSRDVVGMVESGEFREDLFYRLDVFPVVLPPLRDRREDIPDLVEYFLRHVLLKYGFEENARRTIDPEAAALLKLHDWSGNIRDLENFVTRLAVLFDGHITAEDVRQLLDSKKSPRRKALRESNSSQESTTESVRKCGGSVKEAARRAGVTPETIRRRRIKEGHQIRTYRRFAGRPNVPPASPSSA